MATNVLPNPQNCSGIDGDLRVEIRGTESPVIKAGKQVLSVSDLATYIEDGTDGISLPAHFSSDNSWGRMTFQPDGERWFSDELLETLLSRARTVPDRVGSGFDQRRPAFGVVLTLGKAIGERVVLQTVKSIGSETIIGDDCRLGNNVVLRGSTKLGKAVSVADNASVDSSHVGSRSVIGASARVKSSQLRERNNVGTETRITAVIMEPGSKVGDQVVVHRDTRITANRVVQNFVTIGAGVYIDAGVAMGASIGDGAVVEVAIDSYQQVPEGAQLLKIPADVRLRNSGGREAADLEAAFRTARAPMRVAPVPNYYSRW